MKTRLAAALAVALGGCAQPGLSDFRATLARQPSATAALGEWCRARGIADPPDITALPVIGDEVAAGPAIRSALGVTADEPLRYRHVRLSCGDKMLSDARNWYVPARLTPDMNALLDSTNLPFGKIVAPLGFRRERLAEKRGALDGCPAGTILSHRAALRLADGRAIAWVQECYTRANLAGK